MWHMRVYKQDSISELIDHLLYQDAPKTTVIVCSTRESFLQQLIASISSRSDQNLSEPDSQDHGDAFHSPSSRPFEKQKHVLNQTIGLIARSRKMKLLFCPSVEAARALLSILHIRSRISTTLPQQPPLDDQRGVLVIIDIVALHYPTSEFSAQGLSKTLAIAVETAAKMNTDLLLCECSDAIDEKNSECGSRLWELHVPLLSGGSRRMDGQSGWTGRHVSVKSVAKRWFVFDHGEEESIQMDDGR